MIEAGDYFPKKQPKTICRNDFRNPGINFNLFIHNDSNAIVEEQFRLSPNRRLTIVSVACLEAKCLIDQL